MITLLSPGDPAQRTGGYLYNARLVEALRARGHDVDVVSVHGRWPLGPVEPVALPEHGVVVADGLLWTALRPSVPASRLGQVVVLVHSPLDVEGGAALRDLEAAALRGVGAVVATGGPTERDLVAMGVPCTRIEPGTDPATRAQRPRQARLLALGTVTPRKGLLRLLDALADVTVPWRLDVVGSTTRDPDHMGVVQAAAGRLGDRVRFVGEVDDAGVDGALRGADLLVHAAAYEAYGMVLAEAMARGVAVLCTPAGAAEGGGARVVDPARLGPALQLLLSDPAALDQLGDESWRRGQNLPTWDDVASRYEALVARLEEE